MNVKSVLPVLIFIVLATGSFPLSAQSNYQNGVFFEVGGPGNYYSINYERQFSKGFVARIGFSTYNLSYSRAQFIPLTFGKVYGKNKHHLELGGGIDLIVYREPDFITRELGDPYYELIGILIAGYRYQKPDKRFFFRVGLSPAIVLFDMFQLWGGVSAGYRFGAKRSEKEAQ